ncbi:hypothetical protein P5673_018165 [Acropora cervicornis]|uniref:Integrase catalytic domain-containing protein n=1 Tax=Acropora cervicornis TaxID=6130 RepID=A0AAD9V351_ACRCE|nr:hypothetical protein P5673_018165 [Acropora cervicornis]
MEHPQILEKVRPSRWRANLRNATELNSFLSTVNEKTTIPVIAWVFQPFGIPEDFKSDNGPPLTVLKYRKYVQEEGFKHRKVTLG